MSAGLNVASAVALLHRGGVLGYPAEAYWCVGCAPFDAEAVHRLLAILRRPVGEGLTLVGSDLRQFDALIDRTTLPEAQRAAMQADPTGAREWCAPATTAVPAWIVGERSMLAIRITAHPVAAALCTRFGGPLVSAAAALAGQPPGSQRAELSPALLALLDGVCDGDAAPATAAGAPAGGTPGG